MLIAAYPRATLRVMKSPFVAKAVTLLRRFTRIIYGSPLPKARGRSVGARGYQLGVWMIGLTAYSAGC